MICVWAFLFYIKTGVIYSLKLHISLNNNGNYQGQNIVLGHDINMSRIVGALT